MSTLSSQLKESANWKTISQGQCAFRTSTVQGNTIRCKHLFTNTSECHFVGCPIVQSNYVAIQRSYDKIYLVTKNANVKISEMWTDLELPVEKNDAVKTVQDATKKLNPVLKEAVLAKFEHLFTIASQTTVDSAEDEAEEDLE
jgi:hypothetical protein